MVTECYKVQGPSSLALRGSSSLALGFPKKETNTVLPACLKDFLQGRPVRRSILWLIRPWPAAMQPQIRQAVEAICDSSYLKPEEARSIKTVAIALWKASGERTLKDGHTPEVIHAFGVARRVEEMRAKHGFGFEMEEMRAKQGFGFEITLAAILHDAVEDGIMSLEQVRKLVRNATGSRRLSDKVARWVGAMSHAADITIEDYAIHVKRVMADPHTRLIKVCDMLDRHTRLQVKKLFESEQDKTLIQLGLLYQHYDPHLGALVENSARRSGLLPNE